jgi:alpha-D-xyloside xylohydrolase
VFNSLPASTLKPQGRRRLHRHSPAGSGSKLRYRTQQEVLEVAREYRRRHLPLSVMVIDFFHWPNQGTWCFDPVDWPDPKAMVDELKSMGIELMVSVWPTVEARSPLFPVMKAKGLLVTSDRVQVNLDFMGNTTFFDATHPQAVNLSGRR